MYIDTKGSEDIKSEMLNMVEILQNNLNLHIDFFIMYGVLLAMVGMLSMALLEAVKGLLSIKAWFHNKIVTEWFTCWFNETSSSPQQKQEKPNKEIENYCGGLPTSYSTKIDYPILHPFSVSSERAIYALDTEKMLHKLQEVLELKLQNIHNENKYWQPLFKSLNPVSADRWFEFKNVPNHQSTSDPPQTSNSTQTPQEIEKQALDHYEQLVASLTNKIDTLQTTTLYTWGKMNRFASIVIGAVFLCVILWKHFSGIELCILASFGGALSPVAKNLVTALRQIKKI